MNADERRLKVKDIQKKAIIKYLKRMIRELKDNEIEILDFDETYELIDGYSENGILCKQFSGAKTLKIRTRKIWTIQ